MTFIHLSRLSGCSSVVGFIYRSARAVGDIFDRLIVDQWLQLIYARNWPRPRPVDRHRGIERWSPRPMGVQRIIAKHVGPTALVRARAKRRHYKPYVKNARKHSRESIETIKSLMLEFGWTNPVMLDGDSGMVAGHGRIIAADEIWSAGGAIARTERGLVPTIDLHGMTLAQKRAYIIADNASAERSAWDKPLLSMEVGEIKMAGFDLSLTGFDETEVTALLDTSPKLREIRETLKPKQMMRVLISVPVDEAINARPILEQLGAVAGVEVIYGAN